MLFSKYSHLSIAGSRRINEDSVFSGSEGLIVVDGATGLGDMHLMQNYPNDVVWFSTRLTAELSKYLTSSWKVSKIFTTVIATLREEYLTQLSIMSGSKISKLPDAVQLPNACIVFVRKVHNPDSIEITSIGDATTLVVRRDSITDMIWDETVPNLDDEVIRKLQLAAKEENITLFEARKKYAELLRVNRRKANTPEGYWIGSLESKFIPHLTTIRYPIRNVREIIAMTDGYWDAKHVLAPEMTTSEFSSFIIKNPTGIAESLIEAFDADREAIQFPRTKHCDDMTIAMGTLNQKEDND